MDRFEVKPLPQYEDAILDEYAALPLKCADGFYTMIDLLSERNPSPNDWCGAIDARYDLYAVPLPDCYRRRLVLTVDQTDTDRPRIVHGTISGSEDACSRAARIATRQLALVNPSWEPAR